MSASSQPLPTAEIDVHPGRVRASDRERQDAVDRLHHALGEGRLDLAESETRVTVAYGARFRDEFAPLLADLPPDAASEDDDDAPAWCGIWTSVVWRTRMALWGPEEQGRARPTAAQCRTAVWLALAAGLWLALCAVLGAALVAG
jgi:hypothetical protein